MKRRIINHRQSITNEEEINLNWNGLVSNVSDAIFDSSGKYLAIIKTNGMIEIWTVETIFVPMITFDCSIYLPKGSQCFYTEWNKMSTFFLVAFETDNNNTVLIVFDIFLHKVVFSTRFNCFFYSITFSPHGDSEIFIYQLSPSGLYILDYGEYKMIPLHLNMNNISLNSITLQPLSPILINEVMSTDHKGIIISRTNHHLSRIPKLVSTHILDSSSTINVSSSYLVVIQFSSNTSESSSSYSSSIIYSDSSMNLVKRMELEIYGFDDKVKLRIKRMGTIGLPPTCRNISDIKSSSQGSIILFSATTGLLHIIDIESVVQHLTKHIELDHIIPDNFISIYHIKKAFRSTSQVESENLHPVNVYNFNTIDHHSKFTWNKQNEICLGLSTSCLSSVQRNISTLSHIFYVIILKKTRSADISTISLDSSQNIGDGDFKLLDSIACPKGGFIKIITRPNTFNYLLTNVLNKKSKSRPMKGLYIGISLNGILYYYSCSSGYKSNFPGPMYPAGFQLMQRIEPYIEAEDELDIVAPATTHTWRTKDIYVNINYTEKSISYEVSEIFSHRSNQTLLDSNGKLNRLLLITETIQDQLKQKMQKKFSSQKRSKEQLPSRQTKKYSFVEKSEIKQLGENKNEVFFENESEEDQEEKEDMNIIATSESQDASKDIPFFNPFQNFFPLPKKIANGEYNLHLQTQSKIATTMDTALLNPSMLRIKFQQIQNDAVQNVHKFHDKKKREKLAKEEKMAEQRKQAIYEGWLKREAAVQREELERMRQEDVLSGVMRHEQNHKILSQTVSSNQTIISLPSEHNS